MAMELGAIHAAIGLRNQPSLVARARTIALPPGMTHLLELANGEPNTISTARTATGLTDTTLRKAALFYIEQVLLDPASDHYRVLGCQQNAPDSELRRHMALMLKCLHPDVAAHGDVQTSVDRSVFADRVTAAWEDLKSPDRRAAYERTRRSDEHARKRRRNGSAAATGAGVKRQPRPRANAKGAHANRPPARKRTRFPVLTLGPVHERGGWLGWLMSAWRRPR